MYQECEEKDIPLNITTYNYLLMLIPENFNHKCEPAMKCLFDILNAINKKRIKPNVRTLNAALSVVIKTQKSNVDITHRLLMDFKRMNIKFSLATYYYMILIFTQNSNYSLLMVVF